MKKKIYKNRDKQIEEGGKDMKTKRWRKKWRNDDKFTGLHVAVPYYTSLTIYESIYLCIYVCIYLSTYLHIYPSIYVFINLFIHLSIKIYTSIYVYK